MVKIKYILACLLITFFLIFSVPLASFGADTVRVGVVGAMKIGSGQEMWGGALMAAEKINQRGGIQVGQKRMKIRLIKADSNEFLNADYATNTVEMLLMQNMVDFIVGGYRNEAALAMQDVAMDYKKIYISIGAALPELSQRVAQNYDRYKYYFRGGTLNSHHLSQACFLQLDYVVKVLREKLKTKTIKVAIAAEKESWADVMIEEAENNLPKMGLKLVGTFRFSSTTKDASSDILKIIQSRAPLVLTLFSSEVGVSFITQAFDHKLPAVILGLNLEAQKGDFWEQTDGKANYVIALASFAPGVEISSQTKPFMEKYSQRFGGIPSHIAAGTYVTIANILAPAIEQAGSLNSDLLVNIIENNVYTTPQGVLAYEKDKLGRHLHDFKFGARFAMVLGIQWLNGEMKGIWPNKYVEKPGARPLTYKGIVDLKIPPLVIGTHKTK
jgi:branched-chain amino acid transport system substrate-binding protein